MVINYPIEQNPYAGIGPVIGKVLIVCPVTLVNVSAVAGAEKMLLIRFPSKNWKSEFHKWYGNTEMVSLTVLRHGIGSVATALEFL